MTIAHDNYLKEYKGIDRVKNYLNSEILKKKLEEKFNVEIYTHLTFYSNYDCNIELYTNISIKSKYFLFL